MNLSKIRHSAAQVAAAAIFESFPDVELWGGKETSLGFTYDFYFPHPIHPELHFQIEERMRQIVREKREIRELEMVPMSARELLKAKGHPTRAELLGTEGLAQIVQIGSFYDLSIGSQLNNSSEIPAFKIFPPERLEENGMRVIGAAHRSKDELKEFLKKWAAYPRVRHEGRGAEMGLWKSVEDDLIWLPRGLRLREKLVAFFKENLMLGALEISGPLEADRMVLHRKMRDETGAASVGEVVVSRADPEEETGLLDPREGTELQITTSLKDTISYLQSIGKTLNILGFNYCIRLIGPKRKDRGMQSLSEVLEQLELPHETEIVEGELSQINFLVADGLGRKWSAASLIAKGLLVARVKVERNLALLLEQQEPLAMSFEGK